MAKSGRTAQAKSDKQGAGPAKQSAPAADATPTRAPTRTGARRVATAKGKPTPKRTPKTAPAPARRSVIGERPSLQGAKDFARRPPNPGSKGSARRYAKRSTRRDQKEQVRRMVTPGLPAIMRGGFQGFVILLFGGLITLPFNGSGLIQSWVALVAYAWAGNRAASVSLSNIPRATRDGAFAAFAAYLLTIPLREMSHSQSFTLLDTAVALMAALVVGGLAGMIVARARRPRAEA